jgi:hypothetical protein
MENRFGKTTIIEPDIQFLPFSIFYYPFSKVLMPEKTGTTSFLVPADNVREMYSNQYRKKSLRAILRGGL